MKTAVVGGGAAGFFLAINLKEMEPEMEVTIFEKSKRVLAKVEISGGGRCNCTNAFADVRDLSAVYPRGHRLMKRLFNLFDYRDAYDWFERHGVQLTTQDDGCVFPASQDAHTIINCFLAEARRHHIDIRTECRIDDLSQLDGYDFIAFTTGGIPKAMIPRIPDDVVPLVPSLFTFRIDDDRLCALMGAVVNHATTAIPGTKMRTSGPLLITHWGMSGPAILRLSSYAARELAEHDYQMPLSVNWPSCSDADIQQELHRLTAQCPQKQLTTVSPFELPNRLWTYLAEKALGERAQGRWQSLNQKETNRLVNILANDSYQIVGRAPFKDEFVTCGGISLTAVNPNTLESKHLPHVYYAGEMLDIDGVTGGFNFQAAWTTAFTVARAIHDRLSAPVSE